jgi:hypothetical protein
MKRALVTIFFTLLTLAVPALVAQVPQKVTRSLSGIVTDTHHEPLKGAVVEVQNEDDKSVISFLTSPDGHYDFKRINSNVDFTFWATYRGHRSKTHNIGKFNSNLAEVVNLEINLD